MNGKFSNFSKVLAALVGVLMLLQCMAIGSFAAYISPEAVVFTKPEITALNANQIGKSFVYVDVRVVGEDLNDQPVVAYLVDASGEPVAIGYAPVNANRATITLGVMDSAETGKYTVVAALNRAEDVVKKTMSYVGAGDVDGFFEAINLPADTDFDTIREKLDLYYPALSVIKCAVDEEGNSINKLEGDLYKNLNDNAKDAFTQLVLDGVNGKYVAGKGEFDAENSEDFIKEAFIVAAYSFDDMTQKELSAFINEYAPTIGFETDEESLYGSINDKLALVEALKIMASEVESLEELAHNVEKAAAVQLINETHWANLVNVVNEHNDLYGVDGDELRRLLNNKKLRNVFCEEFRAEYTSIADIREAWEKAYKKALKETSSAGGGGGGGGGGGSSSSSGKVIENKVQTQITNTENNKDPNVEIKDYYTDMGTYTWASDAILNLTKAGIVTGYGDKTFAPEKPVTRAEFMKMVVNVFGLADITATSSFTDVDKNAWYYIYVASAEKAGIAQGYGNGLFGINDNVTRQDAITLVYRAAKYKQLATAQFKGSTTALKDKESIATYAVEAVEGLYRTGVFLDGTDPKSVDVLEPTKNASRAYLAVILNQLYLTIK